MLARTNNVAAVAGFLPDVRQYISSCEKIPCDLHGNHVAVTDVAYWSSLDEALSRPWETSFVFGNGYVGLDLDKCFNPATGQWSELAQQMCTLLHGAYVEVSRSGTGLHFIFKGTVPEGHRCRWKGAEFYSKDRHFVLTGNGARGSGEWDGSSVIPSILELAPTATVVAVQHPTGERDPLWNGPEDDDALLALMLSQVPRAGAQMFGGGVTATQVWNMDAPALARVWPGSSPGGFDHSEVDLALMSHLSYFTGRDVPRMERLFIRWPGYRDKYESRGELMSRLIGIAANNKRVLGDRKMLALGGRAAEGAAPSEPGEFYAYLPGHNYYFRPKGDFWPAASVDDLIGRVALPNGHTQKATVYLAQNHAVHDRTWWPGKPEIIDNYLFRDGGMVEAPGKRALNMYRPPLPPMGNPHDVQLWLDHIAMLYPDHWGVVVRWMAFVAQNPGVKVNWALVLGGGSRIGKDSILAPLLRAVGEWNFKDVTPDLILKSDFNEYLQCCVLRINEMKDTDKGGMFQLYNRLKTVIAAPPGTHRINPKGEKPFIIPNLNATVMTTNYQTGGMYLPSDDGRHFVVWSYIVRSVVGDEHYIKLWKWLNSGGMENCAAYLMAIDVHDFDHMSPPEKTPAFWAMVDGGQSDETSDLKDIVDKLGDRRFTLDELAYAAMVANNGVLHDWLKSAGKYKIRRALDDAGVQQDWNDGDKQRGRWLVNGKLITCYKKRSG